MSLLWRVFAINAAGLTGAALALVVTPTTGPKIANWGRNQRESTRIERDRRERQSRRDPHESRFPSGFAG
jgi:hypothetical protein